MSPLGFWICGWFLTAVAVIGDGFVVFLVLSRRQLHTTANWFILSLAMADCLFAMAFLPQAFACREQGTPCKAGAVKYLSSILNLASISNTCLLTLDRYIAISRPFTYLTFMKPRRVLSLIVAAWILPSCVYICPRLIWFHASPGSTTHQTTEAVLHYIFFVVPVLSCTFVSIATAHVFVIVRKHSRELTIIRTQLRYNQTSAGFPRQQNAREISSARVLVIVIVVFVACYSMDIYMVVVDEFLNATRNEVVELILRLLLVTNSAVNPIVYAFFKRDIKKEAKNALGLRRNRVCISNGAAF